MCINLKTFNESFRKWSEENEQEGFPYAWPQSDDQEPEEAVETTEQKISGGKSSPDL
ncbi:hypothetical protein [Telluribacter humicola]|uniref:hypothetical protein n=1 Tax=Telluribacter humicola TaxID=1720261 RepID=UPI001A960013|nr:hypothetical protein [Telluribacter humicola]